MTVILAAIFVLGGVCGAVWFARHRERMEMYDGYCVAQLKHLHYFAILYHIDNKRYPDHLWQLFPHYFSSYDSLFVCPGSGRAASFPLPEHLRRMGSGWMNTPEGKEWINSSEFKGFMAKLGPKHTDYAYVAGIEQKADMWKLHGHEAWAQRKSRWVFIYEKHANHGGMRNVILLEGQIVRMTDARFRERLEQTLREARAAGMDVKIWGDPVAQ